MSFRQAHAIARLLNLHTAAWLLHLLTICGILRVPSDASKHHRSLNTTAAAAAALLESAVLVKRRVSATAEAC